jgi:type IV secretory pathway ATPase VirB11/archaellum biosynthesis ATPase
MGSGVPTVPPPEPPDQGWYAPDVCDQRGVHPGVVATVERTGEGFRYRTRTPGLTAAGETALRRLREHFAGADTRPPRTREGLTERFERGFGPKYARALDRLTQLTPAARRRVTYHALAELRGLGPLTPYALDREIEVADDTEEGLVVHTTDFAPCETDVAAPRGYLDRFASERLARYEVAFEGFSVPVVIYRTNLLGTDPFSVRYAVHEPDLLPGDERLIEECKERIWEAGGELVGSDDRTAFVRERAESLLRRRLTARNTEAWLGSARYRLRETLAEHGLALPPVDTRYATERLDDLLYYVLRDFVGYGQLTVPIRDPNLEDIEANRVDERVKVVPRTDIHHGRVPTNLAFDSETEFVNLVTQLAAEDGVELNAATPSAKVNLDPPGVDETIRCAVGLPAVSEDGPHISIRKQAPEPLTPVELVERDAIPTELVTLLWLLYEHRGVVLYCGPTGVGKTTLMNAHMPFVPFSDRPVSIDEGSREVRLPHETGVSLSTRDHEDPHKRVRMADLMTEANYLNPDIELIAEVNTPASFETFAESLNTGHGLVGTTHAEDVEKLVNRVVEQGLPAYLLRELDLVVFPRHVDGERYVGEAVELLSAAEFERLDVEADGEGAGRIEKDGTVVCWNRIAHRDPEGRFHFGTDEGEAHVLEAVADRTDRTRETVEREFSRKHGYVEYLVRDGRTDFDGLFEFLADLETREAATVERIRHGTGTAAADGGDRAAGARPGDGTRGNGARQGRGPGEGGGDRD